MTHKQQSNRIRYLKSLQHLARKHKVGLQFNYHQGIWFGDIIGDYFPKTSVSDTNFTTMLQKLYKEVIKGGVI